jgi:cytochrome P450
VPTKSPLRELRRDPLAFLGGLAHEVGDVAPFSIGEERVVLLSDPALAREVLVAGHRDFVKQNVLRTRPLELDPDRGLMMNDDPAAHVRGRRIFQPAFSAERLAAYEGTVGEHAERIARSWRDGQTLDLTAELRPLTLAMLAESVFDLRLGDDERLFERWLHDLLASFAFASSTGRDLLGLLRAPRSVVRTARAHTQLLARLQEVLQERRGSDNTDVPALAARALETPDGPTEAQATMDCLGILLAGVDTTATAITWALLELARRPEELDNLYDEAVEADGNPDALTRTRNVFAETLRLYPPSWYIGRRARVETKAGDVSLQAGTVALVSPYLIHRDPRFHDDPDRFEPERRLEDRPRHAYLPFGAGPRQCLGERLAWLEGTLVVAAIARRWRLEPVDARSPAPAARATLAPARPARIVVRAR